MGFSGWYCPVCGMPILNSTSIGTALCYVALVKPDGYAWLGTYDGYDQIFGALSGRQYDEPVTVADKIRHPADEREPGYGDGDGIIVHQACLPAFIKDYLRPGKEFPEQLLDHGGQSHSYTDAQVCAFLKKMNDLWPDVLQGYCFEYGYRNVLAKMAPEDYATDHDQCPACEGTNLKQEGHVRFGEELYRYVMCLDCGSSWSAVYTPKRYEDLLVSEKARSG